LARETIPLPFFETILSVKMASKPAILMAVKDPDMLFPVTTAMSPQIRIAKLA
jgi:hypothetical protein